MSCIECDKYEAQQIHMIQSLFQMNELCALLFLLAISGMKTFEDPLKQAQKEMFEQLFSRLIVGLNPHMREKIFETLDKEIGIKIDMHKSPCKHTKEVLQ